MSNRTNRTLSANFQGLNLGTRSLAQVAGYHGFQALRARHASPLHIDSMWRGDRMRMETWPSLIGPPISIPAPSSPAPVAWPRAVTAAWRGVEVVAEAPPTERPIVSDDPASRSTGSRAQGQPQVCSGQQVNTRVRLAGFSRSKQAPGLADAQATRRLTPTPGAIPIALGG